MKTETYHRFEGIEFKVIGYSPKNDPQKDLEEFLEDDKRIQQEIGVKTRRFEVKTERPEPILEQYGTCDIIISYLCDDFVSWQDAKIIRTPVRNGRQALTFIEHCLNSYGKMSGTPLQIYQPLGEINFKLEESKDGRRTLILTTKAEHPQIMWREMYHIFVAETTYTAKTPD